MVLVGFLHASVLVGQLNIFALGGWLCIGSYEWGDRAKCFLSFSRLTWVYLRGHCWILIKQEHAQSFVPSAEINIVLHLPQYVGKSETQGKPVFNDGEIYFTSRLELLQ